MTRGKRLITVGAIIIAAYAIVAIAVPYISVRAFESQDALVAVEAVVRIMGLLLPPLGAAILGAGLALTYVDRAPAGSRR